MTEVQLIPQEFASQLAVLQESFEQQRRGLAAASRPQVLAAFQSFFEANPEIEKLTFRIIDDAYDDAVYSREIESINYLVRDDLMPMWFDPEDEEYGEAFEYGILGPLCHTSLRQAHGQFSDWELKRGARYCEDLRVGAVKAIEDDKQIDAIFGGAERRQQLRGAVLAMGYAIRQLDLDLAEPLFGMNVTVVVTRDGLRIDED